MKSNRAVFRVIVSLILTLAFAPIEEIRGQSREIVEGAKKEGQLVLYSGIQVPDANALLAAFEKKYAFIKTKHYRSGGGRLISRIETEHRAGRYEWDVYNSTGLEGYVLLEQGHLAKYESPERKFFSEGHKDAEGYWTTMYTSPMLVSYNKGLVSSNDLPQSYSDLLNPKWKGKLGLDSREVEWFANLRKIWGPETTRRFFLGLNKQNVGLREGRALLTQLLGAGEFAILVNNYLQNVLEAKEKGSPIEWLALEPVIETTGPIAMNRMAPHPNAARLFIDFSLSKEGQEILVRLGRTSARGDIKEIAYYFDSGSMSS